jgi:hypothetical protein
MVENRTSRILIPLIKDHIVNGTTTHTDDWRSYAELGRCEEYVHRVVVHKYNFICPISGVHTVYSQLAYEGLKN